CDVGPAGGVGPHPAVSPNGTNVFFIDQNISRDQYDWARIVPVSGGEPRKVKLSVTVVEVNPYPWLNGYTWAPDGKAILYVHFENGVGNIWSAPLDGRPPRKLTSFDSEGIFSFGVSRDNRLALARGINVEDAVLIKNVR